MLKPAIAYKAQIEQLIAESLYSDNFAYFSGEYYGDGNGIFEVQTDCYRGRFQYAIVNNDNEVVGFFGYTIDTLCNEAYGFKLIAFNKSHNTIMFDIYHELKKLLKRCHRIDWRMVGGNPIEPYYDKFCQKYGGVKYRLRDRFKDLDGHYHDEIIYEIITDVN